MTVDTAVTVDPVSTTTCEICGRAPARAVHARKYTGMVLFGDTTFWRGDACRQCGTSLYRTGAAHSMWAGWWGPVPLVMNPLVVVRNLRGLREVQALGEPIGPPLAEPLDPGAPVFRRPAAIVGALVPLAVLVVAVVFASVLLGTSRVDDLAVGDCIDLGSSRNVSTARSADCDDAHSAEVTGRVRAEGGEQACTAATLEYLGGTRNADDLTPAALRYGTDGGDELVCLILATGGGELTGSRRATGR